MTHQDILNALTSIQACVLGIEHCQGWTEAHKSDDPGNVTVLWEKSVYAVWIGPRLERIKAEAERLYEALA